MCIGDGGGREGTPLIFLSGSFMLGRNRSESGKRAWIQLLRGLNGKQQLKGLVLEHRMRSQETGVSAASLSLSVFI